MEIMQNDLLTAIKRSEYKYLSVDEQLRMRDDEANALSKRVIHLKIINFTDLLIS